MADASGVLTAAEVEEALRGRHDGWSAGADSISRSIEFADFLTAAAFVNNLAPRCEELDHHPDLALRWRWVDVTLSTHSAGGVTAKDLQLAGVVDEVAAGLPLAP